MTRTMGLLIAGAMLGCGDSTGPPDPPEFFITTDSLSYTLHETDVSDLFSFDLVTQFTNALPDTVYILSCGGKPFWHFEHSRNGVFTLSVLGFGCAPTFLCATPFPPGSVRTDTVQWFFSRRGPNNVERFDQEIPGTFRASLVVWDSLGEAPFTGREIAKELRVSAPFDILPAPGTGG